MSITSVVFPDGLVKCMNDRKTLSNEYNNHFLIPEVDRDSDFLDEVNSFLDRMHSLDTVIACLLCGFMRQSGYDV